MAGAERGRTFGIGHQGAMPLALLGLDPVEAGVLAVLRHLLLMRQRPESQSWQAALTISVERWGPERAAPIVLAAEAVVGALAQAGLQAGAFRHADPLDLEARGHVSPEEAGLMRMLRAMRRDLTAEARAQMALLTGGRIDPGLVRCGLALARALPAPLSGGVMSRPGPALRLVH